MNKKVIIQIVVIASAFIGAGIVLYNGFFNSSNHAALNQIMVANQGAPQSQEEILPYGKKLDFSVLTDKKRTFYYQQVTYPKLESTSDVGIDEHNLITHPSAN